MRANGSILTAAAETAIDQSVLDFQNAVAAHVGGDWGRHNQLLLYGAPFAESVSGHTITDGYLLRLQLTGINPADGTGDGVFTVPAIVSGVHIDVGAAPVIIQQPANLSLLTRQTAIFTVVALSGVAMTYQWQKNDTDIAGATASTYTLPNVQTADQALYQVIVTNSYGSTTSSEANLTVAAASTASTGSGGGCFTAGTKITMVDGTLRNIEDLRSGDVLKSYRLVGLNPSVETSWETFATASLNATATTTTVIQCLSAPYTYYLKILDLNVTWEHPLLVRRNNIWHFYMAQDIQPGDFLWRSGIALPIDSITRVDTDFIGYNIDTEVEDTYVANGYIAHNPSITSKS